MGKIEKRIDKKLKKKRTFFKKNWRNHRIKLMLKKNGKIHKK